MRMPRREIFRQLGAAAAASTFLPAAGKLSAWTEESPAQIIRLSSNESAYGPGESARTALCEAASQANRYPGEDGEKLRAAIASFHGVGAENVTLGCGSVELLHMAAEACAISGKNLIMATPTFEPIGRHAAQFGGAVRTVPLTHLYAHDLDAMLAATDSATGLIYICNPNNPTGTLTAKADVETFLGKLPQNAAVLIDEAYHDYVTPTGAYASWATRAASDPRLIVTRTFSKVYGLAGLRIGYAISSADMAKRLSLRRLPLGVNAVAARTATAALADQAYVKKIVSFNANERQEFYNQANARMLRSLDSSTNFVLLATGRPGKEVVELLEGRGVRVVGGFSSFEKHIRVTLGLPEEMQAFWRAWDASMPHHPM